MKTYFLFLISILTSVAFAQTTQTLTTSGTFTVPCGVTSISVSCWGGGGAGGAATGNPAAGGGGAGGAFSYSVIPVTGNSTISYIVGAGGVGGATIAGPAGGNTTFSTVIATGGAGGGLASTNNSSAAGGTGSSAGSAGSVIFAGGSGGTGASGTTAGGGGEAAYSGGVGVSGGNNTAGTSANAGGDGGTAGASSAAGGTGNAPGGGGGGGRAANNTDRAGGNGARGEIVISYVTPTSTVSNAGPDQTVICSATTATLAGNTETGFTGAWTTVSGSGSATTPSSATSPVTGLTVGASTTFQWVLTHSSGCSLAADQVVITSTASCPVANDDPTGATPVTVGATCNYTTFTNAGATSSTCGTIPAPGCSSYTGGDVWFSVTVPASGGFILNSQTGVMTDGGAAVYSGSACGVMTLIGCDDDSSPNGAMPMLTVSGQTPGATLYIRFWEYGNNNNGTFGLCLTDLPTAPANDNCAGAFTVAVNSGQTCTSQTGGTVAGATASGIALGSCFGTADDDVWYSFVATSTTHSVNITNVAGSVTDMYHSVYSGACGSLGTALVCSDPNTSALTGLTIGNTYYVRVYTYTGTTGQTTTFSVCITTPPPPPSNDNPCGATPVTVNATYGCTVSTPGTVAGATSSTVGLGACGGTADDDVWFSFVANNSTQNIDLTNITGSTSDMYFSVHPGTCGAIGAALLCSDPQSGTVTGLTVGNTYYLRVYTWTSTGGQTSAFDICIYPPPTPPSNDNPCGATPATVNATYACTVTTGGTVVGATSSTVALGACGGTADDDVWYSFVANNSTQNISLLNLAGSTTDMYFSVHPGTCGAIGAALLCSDPQSGTVTGLTVGNTYYIRIYTWTSTTNQTSTFSLCINPPCTAPSNDNCSGATSVPVSSDLTCTNPVYGTVCGATASGIALGACGGTADDDVWFSFVATNTAQVVSLTNISGSTTDMYHSVYSGSCGSLGTALVCSDPNSSSLIGLTVGNTYYIRVYSWTSTTGQTSTFSVCVTTPPPTGPCGNAENNDFCSNPATLTQGPGTFSSTTSGTYTGDQPGNLSTEFCGSIENNSWYAFVASATSASFPITSVSGCTNGWGVQAEVYSVTTTSNNCCTAFTSVSNCFNPGTSTTGTVTATGLTIGQTYILMFDGNAGDVCAFTVSNWTATGILPIELLTFVGKNEGDKNLVQWVTATEKNSDFFRLEKSSNGVDFEKLLDINAAGNSESTKYYNAFDVSPFEGISYYRLKLYDLDGTYEYSNIISVDNSNLTNYITAPRPNPTNGNIEFDVNTRTREHILIEVYNDNGLIIRTIKQTIEGGYQSLNLDLSNFDSGMYLLKVTFEGTGKSEIQKIIKN